MKDVTLISKKIKNYKPFEKPDIGFFICRQKFLSKPILKMKSQSCHSHSQSIQLPKNIEALNSAAAEDWEFGTVVAGPGMH